MIGFGQRVSYAFRAFFAILGSGEIPEDIVQELVSPQEQLAPARAPAPAPVEAVEPAPPAAESSDRAIQILSILQRDGRLIDFFTEDISPYSDAQIGAAVRSLQENCRQTLERYVKLEPVIASPEDQPVTIENDFDPASIKLIGNVTGKPPLRGLLRHRGWRVASVSLPPLPDNAARSVVAPAEVELQ